MKVSIVLWSSVHLHLPNDMRIKVSLFLFCQLAGPLHWNFSSLLVVEASLRPFCCFKVWLTTVTFFMTFGPSESLIVFPITVLQPIILQLIMFGPFKNSILCPFILLDAWLWLINFNWKGKPFFLISQGSSPGFDQAATVLHCTSSYGWISSISLKNLVLSSL